MQNEALIEIEFWIKGLYSDQELIDKLKTLRHNYWTVLQKRDEDEMAG